MKSLRNQVDKLERWFPCPCGSSEPPSIKYDKDGNFLRYSCTKCREQDKTSDHHNQ
jgi:hypothetical protein